MTIERVRELNDEFRGYLGTPDIMQFGRAVVTEGVGKFDRNELTDVLEAVRDFCDFTNDDDPNGEDDFGIIERQGKEDVYWKIDYYDLTLTEHSPDKADPDVTVRVLTVMLASEY